MTDDRLKPMGLVWVTGVSGSGKSAVVGALRGRGYVSLDADEDNITVWRHRRTGQLTMMPREMASKATWMRDHAWYIERHRVEELAELATGQVVFLAGSVETKPKSGICSTR